MLRHSPISRLSKQRQRSLRLESLEDRNMLSHPAVAAVNVASTQWMPSFVSYLESAGLGTGGYAIPVGSTNQLQTIPWKNVDQIRITFSEDVVVAAADLSVSGVNTTAYTFSGFTYDSSTKTATWTLSAPITKDKLMLDLDANGLAPVRSVATGEVLDGAWINCQSSYPSGDTQGGTDFEFRINVVPGDTNASGAVAISDVLLASQQIGKITSTVGYNCRCDVDGSGAVATSDYSAVRLQFAATLPSGDPVGMTDDAPTTSGIPDLSVVTGTADRVLSLTDFFADAETASDDLVYSIVQNTDSSLFNSLTFDSTGKLDLSFASGVSGNANLTVRATDSAGLIVDATLRVHVSDAPFISNFYCINEVASFWTLTGTVTDTDDDVEGYIVNFGGVLAGFNITATVGADGVFCATFELVGLQEGTGTAQTTDPFGVLSNVAGYWLIV
jgi:hypothetical protein